LLRREVHRAHPGLISRAKTDLTRTMAHAVKGAIAAQIRRLYQGGPRLFCTYSRGPHELSTKHLQNADVLLNNLKSAGTTRSVLEMVAQHNKIMNNKHVLQALRSLFILQKNGNSDLSTGELLGHRDFRKLCRQLRTRAGSIELNETIEALKVVSYVGVPADSTIFQVLLQLIRHNVNNLSLQQIMFLDFLLSQSKSSPLVDALKMALPLVFDIHLPIKMEYDNVALLSECLYFSSKHQLARESVERIVNALMANQEFDAKTAKSLVWSICAMEADEVFRPLMKKAIDSLVVHFDELTFTDVESTLTKLTHRYTKKSSYFYDETFYDSCANLVIDKDLGYKQSVYILRKYARVNYFHKFLLDYMSRKVYENPEVLANGDPSDIYSIAVAASLTDYRPTHWDTVRSLLANSENITRSEKKDIIWMKFAAALCVLDIFRLDVLTKCLDETFLHALFTNRKFMSDFENYFTIWQCIKFSKPEFNCLLSSRFDPEVLIKNFRQDLEFPLERALRKALGGDKYVKTELYSKMGVQIDHAVVFRKGGYPVAMNFSEDVEFVEDIEVPPDNQLVLILGLRHFNYTLNHRRLRYCVVHSIKMLEAKGYQVVPVCLEVWENLADFEKIPYLMQAIKERTNSDLNISEGVI
jgi:FAST kinase domain-containing protein 2